MLGVLLLLSAGPGAAPPPQPEARALAFLAREVPAWSRDNRCFSCHNNGDAARALYTAVRLGHRIPARALADTTRWLERPGRWERNAGDTPAKDGKLAALQFAAALAEAHRAGLAKDRRALEAAARLVVGLQDADGAWRVLEPGVLGSPTTHGTALATCLARQTLRQLAVGRGVPAAVARADRWLRTVPVTSVLDAAAVLLALGQAKDAQARAQRRRCLAQIQKGEARGGGWGPYVGSAPEVFDTAVVLLALAGQGRADVPAGLRRGRAYLLAEQQADGSWTETTRPAGSDSYALRLSTTAWAARALLATR
jgi:hypothetical protein